MKKKSRQCERIEFLGVEGLLQNPLIDLSNAGAAFKHPQAFPVDSVISLKLQEQVLDASVIYCIPKSDGGYRVGTMFLNVPPAVQEKLEILVEGFSRGADISCKVIGGPSGKKM